MANMNLLPSNVDLCYYNADDATMQTLHQSLVPTPAMKVAVDPSVQQPTTNSTYVINQQMHMYKMCFITRYTRLTVLQQSAWKYTH
jgi:hypothetical protein